MEKEGSLKINFIFFLSELEPMHCYIVLTLTSLYFFLLFFFFYIWIVLLWNQGKKKSLVPLNKNSPNFNIWGFGCSYSGAMCISVCSTFFALKAINICFAPKSTELVSLLCALPCHPQDVNHRNKHTVFVHVMRGLIILTKTCERLCKRPSRWSSFSLCWSSTFFALLWTIKRQKVGLVVCFMFWKVRINTTECNWGEGETGQCNLHHERNVCSTHKQDNLAWLCKLPSWPVEGSSSP